MNLQKDTRFVSALEKSGSNSERRKSVDVPIPSIAEEIGFSIQAKHDLQRIMVALDQFALVSITDSHGIITYANDKFCQVSKYTKKELIGQNHRIIKSGFHPDSFFREMWKTISSGRVWTGHIKNKAKDGTFYWVDSIIVPFLDKDGKPYKYVSVGADITALKRLALLEQRDLMYEGSSEPQRIVDTNGIIVDCNKTYADHLGYTKDELVGTSIFETVAQESLGAMRESFGEWLKTTAVFNKEVWFKRKNGTTFPALISATQLFDKNGNLIGSNSVIKDITDIYKIRKELERANEQLKEKDRLKDEFISIASHELRTPIQPILGYAELARDGVIGQEEAWDEVIQNAYRLQRLANDILDVSRIDSGRLKYFMEKISVNDIILEVANNAGFSLCSEVSIETELDEDVEILADSDRISQALANIVGNAIKFTREGKIKIESCVIHEKGIVKIIISDSAGGIPEVILPKLFDKFVTKSVKGSQHGTGLGLYISKNIIDAHGGSIHAYNNDHGGATFTIVLHVQEKEKDAS